MFKFWLTLSDKLCYYRETKGDKMLNQRLSIRVDDKVFKELNKQAKSMNVTPALLAREILKKGIKEKWTIQINSVSRGE